MNNEKSFARTKLEENLEWIAEQIKDGYILSDIHKKLIENNIDVGTYQNFYRLIKSDRYSVLKKAFASRNRRRK